MLAKGYSELYRHHVTEVCRIIFQIIIYTNITYREASVLGMMVSVHNLITKTRSSLKRYSPVALINDRSLIRLHTYCT